MEPEYNDGSFALSDRIKSPSSQGLVRESEKQQLNYLQKKARRWWCQTLMKVTVKVQWKQL
jgi:hypothetical protein